MRLSAKGRYALAAMIHLGRQHNHDDYITVISISETLDISKIYLEQVFSLLKRSGLVTSTKGSQGGYRLTRLPDSISVLDILGSIESALFEETKDTVPEKAPEIEAAMQLCAFEPLQKAIEDTLSSMTLDQLVAESTRHNGDEGYMFYI